jgi:aromatic ring-opening dioxygenase catalytic subunit (LigB family)
MASPPLAPVLCICHGGGPLPLLDDPAHASIIRSLRTRCSEILKLQTPNPPRAIIVVTAHWETDRPTISNAKKHEMLYDYYGFPPEAYELRYDAPGDPEVAEWVFEVLKEAGVSGEMDGVRGM